MATYILSGKYSSEAIKGISASRTEAARNLAKQFGGEITHMYALLGEKDILMIANFPGVEEAMKASVALSKSTGIAFSTHQAIPVDAFDKLMQSS